MLIACAISVLPLNVYAVDFPLKCADAKTYSIRISNVMKGCNPSELSLGAGAIFTSSMDKKELDPQLHARFKAAQAKAAAEGVKIYITSGFRSYARQKALFDVALKKYGNYKRAARWVSPPEISHHPQGLAIDVNYPNDRKGAAWLEKYGSEFGLCRVFENEWWHFEPNIGPGWRCPKMFKDASELLP